MSSVGISWCLRSPLLGGDQQPIPTFTRTPMNQTPNERGVHVCPEHNFRDQFMCSS